MGPGAGGLGGLSGLRAETGAPAPAAPAPAAPDTPVPPFAHLGPQRPTRLVRLARRLPRYIGYWLGESLSRRFVTISVGLLLVIQLASFLVIEASMHRHAESALPERLAMSARVLRGLIDWRAEKLIDGTRLLASDYGFRSAVLSNDRDTIASALENHGARIEASEVMLLDTELHIVAVADGLATAADMPIAIRRLATRAVAAGGASELTVIQGQPRQVVMVPIKAPVVVGWLLASFPLPTTMSEEVHLLSATDLTVLSRSAASQPWSVAVGRLDARQSSQLASRRWDALRSVAPAESEMIHLDLDKHELGVRPIWLTHDADGDVDLQSGAAQPRPEVLALLSLSVDEAVRPPRELQFALAFTTLVGFIVFAFASAYTARRVTTPLKQLATAAERLGTGDAHAPLPVVGNHDEVHELSLAFERMRENLASTQERIVQSEKMASIGQLSAGVAHEINNPIGFVFSNFGTLEDYLQRLFRMLGAYKQAEAQLAGTPTALQLARLREEIELDYLEEDIPALMSESKDGIKRVRKIVQDLKDFSHADARDEWELADLHAGLDSTLNIVNNEIKYKAEVVKAYGTLPPVECLPSELNQVFMNLLVNAAHAIPDNTRGTITLRSGDGGDHVWVEVADTGSGIAPDILNRIFDPFFTTKQVGKGTGLGLSLSYGIVKKHGGRIEVSSEVGVGSTFRVIVSKTRASSPLAA